MLKYDRTTRTAASRASRADAMVAGRKRRLEEANARDRKQPKLAFRPLAPRESDPAKATHAPVEGLAVDTASARVLSIASGFAQSTVAAVAAAPAAVRVTAVVTESDVQMDIRREHAPSGEAEAGVGTGVGAAFVTVAPAIGDSAGPVANDNGDVGNAELEIADGTDGLGHAPPCAEDIAAAAGGEGQDVRSERSIDETTRPAPVQVAASAPVVASAAMQTERHAQELGPVDESVEGDSMASDGAEEVDKQESSVEKGAVVASTAADDAVKQGIVRQWPKGGISKKDTAVKGYWFYHPKHGVSKHMGRAFPTDPRALNASRFLHARELAVRAYLEQRFPGREWAFDKGFAVGVSQRPDALMPVGEAKVIVVEVDENSHDTYDCVDERGRAALFQKHMPTPGAKIALLRFNPDAYVDVATGLRVPSCFRRSPVDGLVSVDPRQAAQWEERLHVLGEWTQHFIEHDPSCSGESSSEQNDENMLTIELFYDDVAALPPGTRQRKLEAYRRAAKAAKLRADKAAAEARASRETADALTSAAFTDSGAETDEDDDDQDD